MSTTTIEENEIKRFSQNSSDWWNEKGKYEILHRMNRVRIEFIKETAHDFDKISVLDIGCGGGLACEPLTRLGAKVRGIDADSGAIEIAKEHANQFELKIDYENTTAEEHSLKNKEQYDLVTALEIVEHVSDLDLFIEKCAELCKPNGLIVMSTLNRTLASYALGVFAAENIMRIVPKGTHSWDKFIKPSELVRKARDKDLRPIRISGISYNPITKGFKLKESATEINYIVAFRKQ